MATMKAALVTTLGSPPKYTDIPIPPSPEEGSIQVKLIAAGLHALVKSRASGNHYTTASLPFIPGVDGVGTLPDGQKVWFNAMQTNTGSMTSLINVPKSALAPLPSGLEPLKAAALFNPSMSSWMALRYRTSPLPPNFTCAILGVTSASGTIAIAVARSFGARKIIGIARNMDKMSTLDLDAKIQLMDPVPSTDFSSLGDVDLILDYLYGESLVHLLSSLKSDVPTQCVQVGALTGNEMTIPAGVMRGRDLTLRGSGFGSWKMEDLNKEISGILGVLLDVKDVKLRVVKLEDVEKTWDDKGDRMVYVP